MTTALSGRAATAQAGQTWLQIEAQPSIGEARDRLRSYTREFANVNGFVLDNGWYGIALGPYDRPRAETVLRQLRASGRIPTDSYLTDGTLPGRRFWPGEQASKQASEQASADPARKPAETSGSQGNTTQGNTTQVSAAQPQTTAQATAQANPEPASLPDVPRETRFEARQNEALLTAEERKQIQVALKWAGFYDSAIDAAFGPGTRSAMAKWQRANGIEPTGILTTRDRATLMKQYNAVLEGLDVRRVTDTTAGIAMKLPMGAVKFARYAYPFAQYQGTGKVADAQVLLISQTGDRDTLAGLYDIMQTLRLVPRQGARRLTRDAFSLTGQDGRIVSHTQAWLKDGVIKGFTLVWPTGDEDRRSRLLDEMQASFDRLPGALSPQDGAAPVRRPDLVSGLKVRKPRLTQTGFFVDGKGTILTTRAVTQGCGQITIDDDQKVQVMASDAKTGLALLRPETPLSPRRVAALSDTPLPLGTRVAVSGYSYGGMLGAPTMTFGELADTRGLSGEAWLDRLKLRAQKGDAGGPVLTPSGAVMGMLMPATDDGNRTLPRDVSFAADAQALRDLLQGAGITPEQPTGHAPKPAERLTDDARGMTVLVQCWE